MSTDDEMIYMVCDDTNNYDINDIDLSMVPPEVMERVLAAIDADPDSRQATA
ncbi:MAG: hypothetical protein V8R08_08980 [Coriobacteriales bacterium]